MNSLRYRSVDPKLPPQSGPFLIKVGEREKGTRIGYLNNLREVDITYSTARVECREVVHHEGRKCEL